MNRTSRRVRHGLVAAGLTIATAVTGLAVATPAQAAASNLGAAALRVRMS